MDLSGLESPSEITSLARNHFGSIGSLEVRVGIEQNLGTVVSNGYGQIQNVELDPVAVGRATPEQVSAAITTALRKAQREAEAVAQSHIAKISVLGRPLADLLGNGDGNFVKQIFNFGPEE